MKFALCGYGRRLSYLAAVFKNHAPDIEIVAYADPEPVGRKSEHARVLDAAKGYDDLRQMLDNETIDVLMIGTPNYQHFEQIRIGLQAGVKIFSEKPIVISEEETFELLQLLNKYDKDSVMVGFVLRYAPLYRDLLASLSNGVLGVLSSMEASEHISPAHGGFFMRNWRRHEAKTGGFLLEKCCHDLDLYQSIVRSRPLSVASFGNKRTFVSENEAHEAAGIYHEWDSGQRLLARKVFGGDADIVDNQVAIIQYENGVNFCFHTNLHVPDHFRRFCIVGSKATAEGDFRRNFFRIYEAKTRRKIVESSYDFSDSPENHYGAEEVMVAEIMSHLTEDKPLPITVIDALASGLTAIKIDEARKLKKVLDLRGMWARFDSIVARLRDDEDAYG